MGGDTAPSPAHGLPAIAAAAALVLALSAAPAWPAPGPEDPPPRTAFTTELPWLRPPGTWEAFSRLSYLDARPDPFRASGDAITRRDVGDLILGVSGSPAERTEASVSFGLVNTDGPRGTNGPVPSDVRVSFGYALRDGDAGTNLAARFTAKVPTAPEDGAAGTDEADVGFRLAAGRRGPRSGLFGSAGLELLGNPLRNGAQDDVATYGMGAWLASTRNVHIVGEVEGTAFSRFKNSPARLSLGVLLGGGGPPAEAGPAVVAILTRGLNGDSARWGLAAGISIRKF